MFQGRVGIALGSGGARGWAHVGVLQGLRDAGVVPEIVCGSSAGAVVGAVYAAGRLDPFEAWARVLDRRQVMSLLDPSLRGGAVRGRRIMAEFGRFLPEGDPAAVFGKPFAAAATDLESGREIWIRQGSLVDALHASCAVPGLVSPVHRDGRWLVDGGIVNPVPVNLCRALGAETVIAVDLNTSLLARRFRGETDGDVDPMEVEEGSGGSIQQLWADLRQRFVSREPGEDTPPSLYEVLNNTLEIMQVRITRSRMAGDPPDLLITPRLPDFTLFDLHRAAEAVDEGRRAAIQALSLLGAESARSSGDPAP